MKPIRLTEAQQTELLAGRCPVCGNTALLNGPCGGASRNVLCAQCHTEFCRSPVISEIIYQPCSEGRIIAVYSQQAMVAREQMTESFLISSPVAGGGV